MKKRMFTLGLVIALLLSLIPCIGTVTQAAGTGLLTEVQVLDEDDMPLLDYQFLYNGDVLTRVTSKSFEYGEITQDTDLTYDTNGRLLSVVSNDPYNPGMRTGFEHTYNSAGQLTVTEYFDSNSVSDTYEYDSAGKLIRFVAETMTDTAVTEYRYNKQGRVASATKTTTYEYYDGGPETQTMEYGYDSQKRLSKIFATGTSAETLTTYHYQYHPFVVSKTTDNLGNFYTEVILQDDYGSVLYTFSFDNATLYTDANGNLARIVSTDVYTDAILTYIFFYDNTAQGTVYSDKANTWNLVYFNYIMRENLGPNTYDDWHYAEYNLIYLDDDSIPELWITHSSIAGGCHLLSYRDGEFTVEPLSSGDLVYEEYGNQFYHSSGRMGFYSDTVYKLEKGQLVTLAVGQSEESVVSPNDVTMNYYWDNIQVNETLYQNKLDSYVYPGIAKSAYSADTYSYIRILDYLFSVDPDSTPGPPKKVPTIRAYTSLPHSCIAVGQERKLLFSLFMGGKPMAMEDYTVTVSDPTVMEVVNTSVSDISRIVTVKGLKPGTAELTFTETATNAETAISLTVKDICRYYKCSSPPDPNDPCGGICIDDYTCTVISNGNHNVIFHAYNTNTQAGYARVYDESGTLIKEVRLVAKYGAGDEEYASTKFYWAWEDLDKLSNGDSPFYQDPYNAVRTSVRLENIPENAQIRILAEENGSEYIELHIAPHGAQNCLSSSYVSVTQANNFSEDTLLKAYQVEDAQELAALPTSAPAKMKFTNIYNIKLLEKGKEIQPGGEIEVQIAVPLGADGEQCIVYRIEENGNKTLLPSSHEDGYITFATDHLSYYIVGEYPRPVSKPVEEPDIEDTVPDTQPPVPDTQTPVTDTVLPESSTDSAMPTIWSVLLGGLLSVLAVVGLILIGPVIFIGVIILIIILIIKKRKRKQDGSIEDASIEDVLTEQGVPCEAPSSEEVPSEELSTEPELPAEPDPQTEELSAEELTDEPGEEG